MEMLRWLATNKLVLAAWGLGFLAILMSWIWGGSKHDEAKPVASAQVQQVAAATDAGSSTDGSASSATTAIVSGAATTVAATTAAVAGAASDSTGSDISKADGDSAEVSEGATDASASSADASTAGTTGDLSDQSSDSLLTMAREAYWNNGLEEASTLYNELIRREPEVFGHKGELGNVLWKQGQPKKAAGLYAEIAKPMIEAGNTERVSNMVGFISLFFPEKAKAISEMLPK